MYTINNVGEAIIAKRRSYTTTVSHLTPPFMESGIHNEMKELGDKLNSYYQLEDGAVKGSYASAIRDQAIELGIVEQLGLGSRDEPWTDQDYFALSNYVETLSHEKSPPGYTPSTSPTRRSRSTRPPA